MIPAHLGEAGYFTGGMKKMHFGPHGEAQFDWYNGGLTRLDDFLDTAGEKPFLMWVGFSDAHRPYADGAFDPPQDPGTVIVPPYLVDAPETRKDLADYYDEVSRLDSVIGEHLAILEEEPVSSFLKSLGTPRKPMASSHIGSTTQDFFLDHSDSWRLPTAPSTLKMESSWATRLWRLQISIGRRV